MANKKTIKRNVPNLRFPEFKEGWANTQLKEICTMQAGKFVSASEIFEKRGDNRFPCYGGNGLRGYTKSFNHSGTYSLIGRQGALCGNVTLAKGEFYATEHAVVVSPRSKIDSSLLYHLLILLNLNQYATGMAQPGLSVQNLEKVECTIPISKIEQKKIASLLTLLDVRIQAQIKIIEELNTLIKGCCQSLLQSENGKSVLLGELLTERRELNFENHEVHSVSVSKGVINQIEYLGRSFAAKTISHYNLAHFGDIIYTKSPTGEFPFGIIKQSFIEGKVAVSPLYGVYIPKNIYVGNILHFYFNNPINTNNYLHSLVQKGAKNTINITNQRFLENALFLPEDEKMIKTIAEFLKKLSDKINLENEILEQLQKQKKYLLQQMFI